MPVPAAPTSEAGWWTSRTRVMQVVAAAAVRTVRVPPTVGVATWPSPHTGVEPASAVRVGSGVAAKTESGSTADLTASRRSVFGP